MTYLYAEYFYLRYFYSSWDIGLFCGLNDNLCQMDSVSRRGTFY